MEKVHQCAKCGKEYKTNGHWANEKMCEECFVSRTSRHVIAFFLGLLSFLVLMFVGETYGDPKAAAVAAVYFFVCQFLLSLDNKAAHRNWTLMLALNFVTIILTIIMVIGEKWPTIVSQAPIFLIIPCTATYLGAVMASLSAKRKKGRRS